MPAFRLSSAVVKFKGLDVLRCCAALSIVVYHSTFDFKNFLSRAPALFLHNLVAGVDFFLLISGFLITYLLLAEKGRADTISLPRFYLRRALRIFPLYYAIIALGWVLHNEMYPDINFASYLYFGGNFWMIAHSWTAATLNPLWSLCIEEQFYLLIPLLVLLIPTRRLPWLFGAIILTSIAFRAYISIALQGNWMMIYCHTLSRCDVLALGGWLAWQHFTAPIRWALPHWALLVAVLFLGLLLTCIDVNDFTALNYATLKKYLYLAPMAFILCFVLFNDSHTDALPSTIGRTLNYLGKISYGIYMYHSPLIFLFDVHLPQLQTQPFLRLGVVVASTIVVAALSYELFEKQILRLKSRFEVVQTVRA